MDNNRKQILHTIIYSDIFDYPLSQKELWKFLLQNISLQKKNKKIRKTEVLLALKQANQIKQSDGLYFLEGREHIVELRRQREKESKKKIAIAEKTASIFSLLPTIRYIGISGGVAMHNADRQDDIDFFIICSRYSMWISRLLCLIILEMTGKRRKRNKKHVSNLICLNMFVEDPFLTLSRQDVFTAHEVIQLYTLVNKNNTYERFINANNWIFYYIPNISKKKILGNPSAYWFFWPFDFLAKYIQLLFINMHKTNETVNAHLLAFHPYDYRSEILDEFRRRIKRYEKI